MCFFFFQAEDGIRDATETGVQTCALPILDLEIGDIENRLHSSPGCWRANSSASPALSFARPRIKCVAEPVAQEVDPQHCDDSGHAGEDRHMRARSAETRGR